jgi:cytochrome c-type biogenesis protein CcmH
MRQHVQSLVEDGKSHSEVVDFMIERFGEFVTYKPRVKPATYLLWYGPWVLVILGFFIILTRVRTTPRPLASEDENKEPDPEDQTDMQKINSLLSKYETLDDQPDPNLPQTNKDP